MIPPAVGVDVSGRDNQVVVEQAHRMSFKVERCPDVLHQAVALAILTEDLHLPRFRNNKSNSFFTAELVR